MKEKLRKIVDKLPYNVVGLLGLLIIHNLHHLLVFIGLSKYDDDE